MVAGEPARPGKEQRFHCRFFSLMRYNNVIINLRLQLHSNKCRNRRDNTISNNRYPIHCSADIHAHKSCYIKPAYTL